MNNAENQTGTGSMVAHRGLGCPWWLKDGKHGGDIQLQEVQRHTRAPQLSPTEEA